MVIIFANFTYHAGKVITSFIHAFEHSLSFLNACDSQEETLFIYSYRVEYSSPFLMFVIKEINLPHLRVNHVYPAISHMTSKLDVKILIAVLPMHASVHPQMDTVLKYKLNACSIAWLRNI